MIDRTLHFVWVGDGPRPDDCIESWRALNPGYAVRIWGNRDLVGLPWRNARHMRAMLDHELCGVADLMRYEILLRHGGIALDADSICLRPLAEWLLEPSAFACWENEWARPGLVACGALGFAPGNPMLAWLVEAIRRRETVVDRPAWQTVGPEVLTVAFRRHPGALTVYPSHYFYPEHHTGLRYAGSGPVFARQLWASTPREVRE